MRRSPSHRLRVLYLATRGRSHYRTARVSESLRALHPGAVICVPEKPGLRGYLGLIPRALQELRRADLVMVGFWGQPLMPLVRLLTRRPVLFDFYVSTHNRVVLEAKDRKPGVRGPIAFLLDRAALLAADLVTVHTLFHLRHMALKYRVPREKMVLLPLCSGSVRREPAREPPTGDRPVEVHWHGCHLAHHGVDVILRAAARLRDRPIHFTLVGGKGPCYEENRRTAERLGLDRVTFLDDMSYEDLLDRISGASICLGVFGAARRTKGVVSNKVVDAFAARRCAVTGRTRATRLLLEGREAAHLVPLDDPEALAEAIRRLGADPALRHRLADEGHRLFRERLCPQAFNGALGSILTRLTRNSLTGART